MCELLEPEDTVVVAVRCRYWHTDVQWTTGDECESEDV